MRTRILPGPMPSGRQLLAIVAVTLASQFILLSISFPISELLTEKPLFYIDGGFHWYQVTVGLNLAKTGNIVGYDPYFNAGYPAGVTYNWSGRGATVVAFLLQPWFDAVVSYKLYVFASALLAPLCVALALWGLGLETRFMLAGTLLGFLLWWTSVFRWYGTAGMVAFVTGSFFALPYLVAVMRFLGGHGGSGFVACLAIAGAAAFFYHPFFPIPIVAGTVAYCLAFWRSIEWKRIPWLGVVAVISLATNLFWLLPTRHYQIFKEVREHYQSIVDINIVWQELLGRWSGNAQGSKEYAVIAFLSLWGWCGVKNPVERRMIRMVVVVGLGLVLFAAVGATVSTFGETMQPNRFAPVGYLLLVIPATYGLREIFRVAKDVGTSPRVVARVSIALLVSAGLYLGNELRREVSWDKGPHYGVTPPEVKELGEYSLWVIDWLKRDTTNAGRILFETSMARIYDGSHMAGYYAYTTDRDFIGGPYTVTHFTGFWDGFVFDKPIETITGDEFGSYMDLYNVGWILVHSERSKAYLDSCPLVAAVASFKELKAYRVKRDLSYFIEGQGRVKEREHNKVVLSDLAGPHVVLKFHFIPGLQTVPPVSLVPVRVMDDPAPFVKIMSPPKEVRLFLP